MKNKIIIDSKELEKKLTGLVQEILLKNKDVNNLAFVGIKTRGEYLAGRLVNKINKKEKTKVPLGTLDITLYRDDLRNNLNVPKLKKTDIPFNVDNKNIILVDDVLYTGRTIRAAIDAIMDYGRPSTIQLAVLVDRGLRELPIQPDYTGIKIETKNKDKIEVLLKEYDSKEHVVLIK